MGEIKEFYVEIDKDKPGESTEDSNFRKTLNLFEKKDGTKFLDIGCYDGSKTAAIRDFTGAEAHGIDFLQARLDVAKEKGIDVKAVDLSKNQKIDFPDESFDFIFCGDVIEHLFSPDFLIEEIHRMLKRGGYAVITTPNLATWKNRIALLFGWQPFFTEVSTRHRVGNPRLPKGTPSGHIRMFTPGAMKELFQLYGFEVERMRGDKTKSGNSQVEKFTGLIDTLFVHINPKMCDKIEIKIRKPLH